MITLLRARMRRDRVQVLLWIVGTALLAGAGYAGVVQSYGTVADRQEILAAVMANPVILMFRGLPSGTSEGEFLAFLLLPWLAMLAALMSAFLAVRHTRGDEEAGRAELISATPAGRTTPILATIVHGTLANLVLAAATALTLMATGFETTGSIVTGAAAGMTGLVFLGVGLVASQLMRTSRGANALTVWTLMLLFLVRGIGNAAGTPSDDLTRIDSSWIAWLSPFGWAEQTRPFDSNAWMPVLLGVFAGVVLAAAAAALQSARDLGASFFPERRGPAHAARSLSSPAALVWRLTGGALVGWAVGGALTGVLATTLSSAVDQIAGQNPAVAQILNTMAHAGSLDEALVTVFFTMLGILGACAAVQTVVHARQEEARGTAEPVLAGAVGRVRWLAGYLFIAVCAVAIVAGAGVAAACAALAATGGRSELYRVVLVTGLGQAVAASVFAVVAGLVFVLLPRATIGVAWALVVVATMLGLFGPLFGLPEWATDLSPFTQTPVVTQGVTELRGLWWLAGVVVAGAAAALLLMRRREAGSGG